MTQHDLVLDNTVSLLDGMAVWDGARFIEGIAAEWINKTVNRAGDSVSDAAANYVQAVGMPRNWTLLPKGESHWRVIYAQFHKLLSTIVLNMDEAIPTPGLGLADLPLTELTLRTEKVSAYLAAMPIADALEWLIQLVKLWAIGYDERALLDQIKSTSLESHLGDPRYFPIRRLMDLTEPP